jgi:hypothetical protein
VNPIRNALVARAFIPNRPSVTQIRCAPCRAPGLLVEPSDLRRPPRRSLLCHLSSVGGQPHLDRVSCKWQQSDHCARRMWFSSTQTHLKSNEELTGYEAAPAEGFRPEHRVRAGYVRKLITQRWKRYRVFPKRVPNASTMSPPCRWLSLVYHLTTLGSFKRSRRTASGRRRNST